LKVLILGDSPYGKTGFGRVNYHAVKGFLDAGLEVGAVTALQTKSEKTAIDPDPRVTLFVPEDTDVMGIEAGRKAIAEWEPDVLYATGDPGNITAFSTIIPTTIPFYAYIPIEGEPLINHDWQSLLDYIDFSTCSQYGADVVKRDIKKDVDFIYHGVEESFTPLSDEERDAYRKRLEWDGKFVVSCVAQNVNRKQLPRLIEAVAILKRQFKQRDMILYLHTVPFQGYYLDGWRLPDITEAYGVFDEVIFNPLMGRRWASIPERGDLENPGLRELLGSTDLFVLPSKVEGFGLPIAEAMAVGVPVMVTKYAAGYEVARHGQGVGIPVHDWEVHKSGTRYAHVDPLVMAKEILRLRRNPKQLARMRAAGIEAAKLFDWAIFEKEIAKRVIHAAETKTREASDAEANQATAEAPEANDLRGDS
jgi:glycosyltransferase involved in cell wall biosynthesis